jgi:Fic family protein
MWNWEEANWPNFEYDETPLKGKLMKFDFNNQISLRDTIMFENSGTDEFVVSIHGLEALKTSEIEGENYDLSSLMQSFGVHASIMSKEGHIGQDQPMSDRRKSISGMMGDLYHDFAEPLTHETLHKWNNMITGKSKDARYAGKYRNYAEAMQVKSSTDHRVVEFEAPPSKSVQKEMAEFIQWYNDTGPDGKKPMHPVIRAGLAHLYFVSIHPYDDGNGRISRALAVKVISEHNNEPTLISLSHAIADDKQAYYNALQQAQKHNNVQAWLDYFTNTAIKAQEITKTKLYQAAVIKTHDQRHDLSNCQKSAIQFVMEGNCKRQARFITVSEYIEANKPELKNRAKEEERGLKDLAIEDLEDLKRKRVFKLSREEGKAKYILVYPRTPGISAFIKQEDKEVDKPVQMKQLAL